MRRDTSRGRRSPSAERDPVRQGSAVDLPVRAARVIDSLATNDPQSGRSRRRSMPPRDPTSEAMNSRPQETTRRRETDRRTRKRRCRSEASSEESRPTSGCRYKRRPKRRGRRATDTDKRDAADTGQMEARSPDQKTSAQQKTHERRTL